MDNDPGKTNSVRVKNSILEKKILNLNLKCADVEHGFMSVYSSVYTTTTQEETTIYIYQE